jgi:hypothetical protein
MSSKKRACTVLVLLLCVAGIAIPVFGQAVNGSLVGTVTDSSGAAIPNAKVTIVETATAISRSSVTNESGNYSFPDLTPGRYAVTVDSNGFKRETRPVDVIVDSTSRADMQLQPGSATEVIEVRDVPALLQTDRADVTTKLEAQQVQDLPLSVNRNFQALLNLVPGTAPATFQHSQFFNAQSTLQTEVNGLPRQGNSYQIEGIDDDERTGLLQVLIPPAEAISTVDVSTDNYDAELGRAVGAVTNAILKSGTNSFHGSAMEYLQNSAFNARSYFNPVLGHVAYNYFGGSFGGPIKKDKIFIYGDYFRTSDHEANSNLATIPFPQFYTPNANGFIDLSAGLKANGQGQIYDPATGNQTTGAGRTPFAGNLIPINRVNSVSLALLHLLPAPNQNLGGLTAPANNYAAALPFQKTGDTYDGKVDWQLSDKNHLSGRLSYQKIDTFQAPIFGSEGGGPAQGNFEGIGTNNSYSTGLNYDRVFSPTLVMEARLGVAHYRNTANPSDFGTNDASAIGIPGVNISPFTSGQVGISVGGGFSNNLIGYSASLPWIRGEANIDFANHWTKIVGNHTFKFGADIRRIRDDLLQDQTFSPRGVITFGENQTSIPGGKTDFANDMASFLLDVPSSVGRDLNTFFPAYRQWWFFTFAGDKWQVTPKLTLDLGLRWEFYPPATPKSAGGFSNYDPTTNSLVIAGIGGNPSNLGMQNHYDYLAPRTGFAYRLTEKTVIRGGFGISYTPFEDNTYAYNYPVRANNSYTSCLACSTSTPAVLNPGDPTSVATFQAGFPAPVPVAIPANGIIPANTPQLLNQNYFLIPTNYRNPYVESWNLTVQQALPAQFTLQLGYVANHGSHIGVAQNINLPPALGLGNAGEPEAIAFKRTAATNQYFLGFSSNYQSLQTQLNRRFTNGLLSTTAFTWGKGLGYQIGDDGGLNFWIDQRHNYARNDFDRTLNFEQSFVYELPFGRGKRWLQNGFVSNALGGWKIGGIVSVLSGLPFTVTANSSSINTPGQTLTANLTGTYKVLHGIGSNNAWFDPTAFTAPPGCPAAPAPCPVAYGTVLGDTGRNQFTGPGYIQDNISLYKTFQIRENVGLEARADAFQLSNTPQFNNPCTSTGPCNAQVGSGTFGKVTSTLGSGISGGVNGIGGGRVLQLSATVRF